MKFNEYLEKVYAEQMQGSLAPGASSKEFVTGKGAHPQAQTYQLELAGNMITGFIGNEKISMSLKDFAFKYKDIANEVLPKLKADGMASYAPNNPQTMDFVKNPQTKNTMVATPDQV